MTIDAPPDPRPPTHRFAPAVRPPVQWVVVTLALVTTTILIVTGLANSGDAPRARAQLSAATPDPTRIVNPVPAAFTPQFDGRIYAIAQVGDTMVVGGKFTTATQGGTSYSRANVIAFSATTGAVNPNFAPSLNGTVQAIEPGPTTGTVYIAGSFTSVDGVATPRLTLLNTTTGKKVGGFTTPNISAGTVNDLAVVGGRLLVGGTFKQIAGKARVGFASLSTTSGSLDSFASLAFTGHHNASGSGAQGATGISEFAVNNAGSTMVAIGNFTDVSGDARDQVAMIDLSGGSTIVQDSWNTTRYQPACYKNAFDSYVRDVEFAPNGSYFAIVSTGGPAGGTLCDAATRWETNATGADVQPTWVDNTGGDTLYSVEVTADAVYVGGHQRWVNNTNGSDFAGAGGVPRPGIAALDPLNGVPLQWNPGRNPRGVAVFTMYSGAGGLWTGSNTNFIGNHKYRRQKLAFFPTAGGTIPPDGTTPLLPGNVYLGGSQPGADSNILYRVNAGGSEVGAVDNGPSWAADTAADSPLRNSGSNGAGYASGAGRGAQLPASTPSEIFDSERWDPGGGNEMAWSFPVPTADHYTVRLYFANRCACTNSVGARTFDVSLDGEVVLPQYDIVADAGDQVGTMQQWKDVGESDGTVDISFEHRTENPLLSGIEIINTDKPAPSGTEAGLRSRTVDGTSFGADADAPDGKLDWSTVRGAVEIGGTVFYASADAMLYRKTFDGSGWGPVTAVNPYSADPVWNDVKTGSGQTYQSVLPQFYSELPSLTGMTFRAGALYYTRTGSTDLYYRGFSPDSGVVSPQVWTVPGVTLPDNGGLFLAGNSMYTVSKSTGALAVRDWNGGAPGTSSTVVSGPVTDGIDWRARSIFVGP